MFGLKKKKEKMKVYYSVQGQFLKAWCTNGHLGNKIKGKTMLDTQCKDMFGSIYMLVSARNLTKGGK